MAKHSYLFYGLHCNSNIALPLPSWASDGAPDLEIDYGGRAEFDLTPPYPALREFRRDAYGWLLHYVDSVGEWSAYHYSFADRRLGMMGSSARDDLFPPLLGPVAATLWRTLGACVLHGAAVEHGGRGIAILGASGAGKSTLTAALLKYGCRLVSDDVLVLAQSSAHVDILAGPDRFSITAEMAKELNLPIAVSPGTHRRPGSTKLWLDAKVAGAQFRPERAALASIYMLEPWDDSRRTAGCVQLPPREAALALLKHLYGSKWLGLPDLQALQVCTRLANTVPIRRLACVRSIDRLDEVADMVLEASPC